MSTTPHREHEGAATPGFFSRLFSSAKKARVTDSIESTSMESNFVTEITMKTSSANVETTQANEWKHHTTLANFSIGPPSEKKQAFNRRRRVPTRPQSYTLVGRPRRRPVPKEWNPSDFDHILQSNKYLFLRPDDEDDIASLTLPLGTKRLMGTNQSGSRLIQFREKDTKSITSASVLESSTDVKTSKVSFTEQKTPSALQTKLRRQQTPAIRHNQTSPEVSLRSTDMNSDNSSLQKSTAESKTFEITTPSLPRTDFDENGPYIFDGDKILPPSLQNFKPLVPFPTLRKPKSFPIILFTKNERFKRLPEQEVKQKPPQKIYTTEDDENYETFNPTKKTRTEDMTWGAHMFQKNKWQCDNCKVFNEQELSCCPACETARPGIKEDNVSSLVSKDTATPAPGSSVSFSFGVVPSVQNMETKGKETHGFSFGTKSDPKFLSTATTNSSLHFDNSNEKMKSGLSFSFGVVSPTDTAHKEANASGHIVESSTGSRSGIDSSTFNFGSQKDFPVSKNRDDSLNNNSTVTFPMTFASGNAGEIDGNREKRKKEDTNAIKKSVGFSFGVPLSSNSGTPSITANAAPPSFSFGSTAPVLTTNGEEPSSNFADPKSKALNVMSVQTFEPTLDQAKVFSKSDNSASFQDSSTTFKFEATSKIPDTNVTVPSFTFGKSLSTEATVDSKQTTPSEIATNPSESVLPSSSFSFGTTTNNNALPNENKSLVRFGAVEESTPAPKFSFGSTIPEDGKKSSVTFGGSQREIDNAPASAGPLFTFGSKPENPTAEVASKSSVSFAITPKADDMTTRFTFGSKSAATNGDSSGFGMTTPGPFAGSTNVGTVTPAPTFSFGMSTPAVPKNSSTLFAGSTPAPVNFGGGNFTPCPPSNSFLAGSTPGPVLFGGASTSAPTSQTFLAGSTPAASNFGGGTPGINFGTFQASDNNNWSSSSVIPAHGVGPSSFDTTSTIPSAFATSSSVPSLGAQTALSSSFGNPTANVSFGASNTMPSVSFGSTSTFGGPAPAPALSSSFGFGTTPLPTTNVSFGATSAPSTNFGANNFGQAATPTPVSGGFTIGSSSKSTTGRRIVRAKRLK